VAKLPVISGARAVKAFQQAGWHVARQRGSHVILPKPGHIASLSIPSIENLPPGTLRSLLRASGLTLEEFTDLL